MLAQYLFFLSDPQETYIRFHLKSFFMTFELTMKKITMIYNVFENIYFNNISKNGTRRYTYPLLTRGCTAFTRIVRIV